MREVQKKNYCYSNDEYLSVFVGVCKSQELLDQYLEQDYELLNRNSRKLIPTTFALIYFNQS